MCRVSGICPEGKPARTDMPDKPGCQTFSSCPSRGLSVEPRENCIPSKEAVESLGKEPKPLSAGAQSTGSLSKAAGEVMTWLGPPRINAASHLSK